MSDRDILEEMQKSGSQRYKPFGSNVQAQTRVATLDGTRKPVQRASRTSEQPLVRRTADYSEPKTRIPRSAQQQPQPRRTTQAYQQQRRTVEVDTNADVEVVPSVRTRREKVQLTRKLPPSDQGYRRLIVGVVLGMIVVLWLAWIATTVGASYWATHVTDPGIYGPTHGNVVSGVFGGGDSQEHPTKLIAFNNDGHVEIIKIIAGDPKKTQIIPGYNLIASGFPDPTHAVVELSVDDHHNVIVTVYGSTFYAPFQRYFSKPITLYNDGKGNLKAQTGGQ